MKNSIRKEILEIRSKLSLEEKMKKSEVIWKNLSDSKLLEEIKIILNYADFRNEVSTKMISEYAFLHEIPLYYPKVNGNDMNFYQVKKWTDLKAGYQSILEPLADLNNNMFDSTDFCEKDILVIIPGSVFSKDGVRYGYGKGFYDRFLVRHTNVLKVAFAYSFQVLNYLEREEHDILMDYIITEKNIIRINND